MQRDFPNNSKKKNGKAKAPAAAAPVPAWRRLVEAHSPYLAANLQKIPEGELKPQDFAELLLETRTAAAKAASLPDLMKLLRQAKMKVATRIAIGDLDGSLDDMTVTQQLSDFADVAVQAALAFLLRAAHAAKTIKLKNAKNPFEGSGISVIALGKWGAGELNYSSDIDLMVIFDPLKSAVKDRDETQNFFIRLTRELARTLDAPTEDGYVFRTDLRLRPDPGAMPLAVSIAAAETYYGSLGQNWERAAMIKARPVAGDETLGADFMRLMQSWIWRKNLDFAAIQDIHSIKRQINARQKPSPQKGQPFLGFNVKLGHGGIREIEFFAQTQQLIYGGREMRLRTPQTLAALKALAETGHITAASEKALRDAYLFLRHTEHRLQMQDDRQTHSLPVKADALEEFARFMTYAGAKDFITALTRHTDAVKKLYAGLFTEFASLGDSGNLVFTGVEDDPETLETLKGFGFKAPSRVTAAIRGWHHGRYRAVRSERARQILTEITPHLLKTLGATPHPDEAFIRFDQFLSRLPSGIPIFSMFAKNPKQMELVADVMGTSPALAEHLGSHPQVLDGVLSRDFFGDLPEPPELRADLASQLNTARDYQDVLDATRRWAREKRFHAGIHILKNLSDQRRCGRYLSDIAEAALTGLLPHVAREFAGAHGVFKTGEFMVLAMGSFAAKEMFADSDLDIVGLYRTGAKEKASNGAKPLPPNVYYIRLMQRLIAALSAPTAEGVLYAVDARLRPGGNDGPLAAQLEGFFEYQRRDAWAWEHMSLIRARLIVAAPETVALFNKTVRDILTAPRDAEKLRRDMRDMRAKVEKQFSSKDAWNMKYRKGGVMDIMFAAHFLVLSHAAEQDGLLHPSLEDAIAALGAHRLLTPKDMKALLLAYHNAQAVQGFLRLSAELPFKPAVAAEGLKAALIRSASPHKKMTFKALAEKIAKDADAAHAVYDKILGGKTGKT
ncbi:MAG: bifunctional [glutamine synthetase] adenylyltransferase/[glutamine synthetase]-adenylyl-L-tyrosine phosphorylase [Micavibrio sp.]|nr:bifunctional [glutamine synthetase] adenylyltransferase/[glutamine synthetase]-adenylyl-L-tyrosine phosphorylase [Micavibrio sp.]